MYEEYKEIDLDTGAIIDTHVVDSDSQDIPPNFVKGWGNHQSFFNPIYDLETQSWVEYEPYETLLNNAKNEKDLELNEACRRAILAGFSHVINGQTYWFSYDMEAQGNFRDGKEALQDGIATEILWTVRIGGVNGEYTRIPITLDIMNELRMVIMNHKTEKISKYRDFLMPIVLSATTVEEVRSVQW